MPRYSPFLILSLMALGACSGAKDTLGLNKSAPDEFQVVRRAPLEMPPDYSLRPPRPGAPRPQEQTTFDTARQTVFGQAAGAQSAPASSAAEALLQQAGAQGTNPDIRRVVDAENKEVDSSKTPVVKKILNLGRDVEPPAEVVDPAKEAQRIKSNKDAGKPVTAGETPTKEQ